MRMRCRVEFGESPNLVQLEFVKFVSCTGRFPRGFGLLVHDWFMVLGCLPRI